MNIASYFCPFSNSFHATTDFKKLSGWEKFKTITLTALATLVSIPILGLGGVAVFRAMVGHYTKIDPKNPDDSPQEQTASRVDECGREVIEGRRREMEQQFAALANDQQVQGLDDDDVIDHEEAKMKETEPKPLDKYGFEDVQAYISMIKEGEKAVLEGAHRSFMEQFETGKAIALNLHEEYRSKFEEPPQMDSSGNTDATLAQFKLAQRILKKEFPGLSSLAFNLEQKCAVARLMQIIMCGQTTELPELPRSQHCFIIRDLKEKSTEPKKQQIKDYLIDCLEKLQAKKENESYDNCYKRNFLHAMHLFVNDCLNRSLNSFFIKKDKYTPLGREVPEPAGLVKMIRDQLIEELQQNPELAQCMVQEARGGQSFASFLKYWFPVDVDDGEILPESVLEAVLAEEKEIFQSDEVVRPALDQLIANCRLDQETVEQLVVKSGCQAKEIDSLVRMRVLQMMTLMHQGFQQDHLVALLPHLHSYGDEEPVLHPKTTGSIFISPPRKMMEDMTILLTNEVVVTQPDFHKEGLLEHFERDTVSLAEVETFVNQSGFSSKETAQTVVGISSMRVSWQITETILDHLVGQIDPDIVASQPKEKYPILKEGLQGDLLLLDEIAKIQPQSTDTSSIWNWYSAPSVSEELRDVQRISEVVGQVSEHCHEFFKTIAVLGENREQDIQLLQQIRGKLLNATGALLNLKGHYEATQQDEQVEILGQILGSIDNLVGQLPEGDLIEAPKTYWKRLAGAFGQSQDAKDLEWKVHKYETQVLELRRLFENAFPDNLGNQLDGSWIVVDGDLQKSVIGSLYATLTDVKIDLDDDARYTQEYLANVRQVINDKFIPTFRKEFDADSKNPYLMQIAELLFTQVVLEEQCFGTLETFNAMGASALGQEPDQLDESAHGEHEFVKWVNTVYKRLGAVPYSAKAPLLNQWANSARGQWNRDFDPYRQGNPTHHFWNLKVGDRVVKMLGMGTPTHEDSSSIAHLNQEFVALMKNYKATGKRHLYVNNQNLIPKTGWLAYFINGDETARSDLILDFQDDEEVKGAYYAIALSKNSQFYWQKGEWADASQAQTFKESLFDQVCKKSRNTTGCYIPQTIRDLIPDFDDKAKNIITQIHEKVFEGRDDLTQEERCWFIELFYDNLQKMILVEGKFDSANGSCKDQIDRGAGTNAQFAANCYVVAQDDGELTQEQQKHVMMMMMVRALLVRKRPPLNERVERFTEGLDMTFKHVNELKTLHQELFPGITMMPQQVAVSV